MTYATDIGEFSDSTQVRLPSEGDLGTSGSAMLAYLGVNSLWYAERDAYDRVAAAEARGVPASVVATWRMMIPEYVAAKDFDNLLALQLAADGWTAQGNQGPITQQVTDAAEGFKKSVVELANKAQEEAASKVNKLLFFGGGLAVLYVVLKARN